MTVRKLFESEIQEAVELIWEVFSEFEAPEYSQEGIKNFKKDIESPDFITKLEFYGAFDGDKLAGVAATRNIGSHISLFFVKKHYQRLGLGKLMFEKVCLDCPSEIITVNSSPYAVKIYRRLGFEVLSTEQNINGIRFVPMSYKKRLAD